MSTRQKSFFEQAHKGNKPRRPQYSRTRSANDVLRPQQSPTKSTMQSVVPIAPGAQTKRKLKSFQFIEGKPSSNRAEDECNKENSGGVQDAQVVSQQTPVKAGNQSLAPSAKTALPPSTPATRLPLADLIGNPDEKPTAATNATPEEHVLWLHAQTPGSSHPTTTPARKRKRARSSSPASSQNEASNFFLENKETFDVQGLQQSLKTPQADPAADLWNRYASANDGSTATKSIAFAHLIRDSSPRSSATAGSVSGLRRWASCGVEWPISATKSKRRRLTRRDEEEAGDMGQVDGDLPKMSKVGLLLERMKETLSKPSDRIADGPSSSSPLPERVAIEFDSPLHRLAPVQEDPHEESLVDQNFGSPQRSSGRIRKSQSSSSEFGDADIDIDMLEAIEGIVAGVQMEEPTTIVEPIVKDVSTNIPISRNTQINEQRPPDAPTLGESTSHLESFDEFGEDDDLFAEDLEQLASKYDSQAVRSLSQRSPQCSVPTPGRASKEVLSMAYQGTRPDDVQILSDDEFGDDDIDDEQFAAAEVEATQALHVSVSAPTSSEPDRRAIQRYLVKMIQEGTYNDERGRKQAEKVLLVEETKTKLLKNIMLRQSWIESPCTISSYVHVIGNFDKTGQCVIDNSHNILILHPDHLISATVVADSFGCVRRAVLQDRVKATGEANAPMMYGHILHELFQEALKANEWDDLAFDKLITAILPRHYETMVEIGLNLNQVREHLKSKIPEIRSWAEVFVRDSPRSDAIAKGRNGQQSTISITKLLDVEEHIWSPNYGLKGNVDATVQVVLNEGNDSRLLTVPFELKTGKRVSEHHMAQTALYTLLVSDRYDVAISDGILYYMETSTISRVQAIRHELIHLIMKRNELACYVRERLTLPPMLPESRQRLCNNCYAQTTCFLYHKLAEDGTSNTIANKGKYEELVRYLKPADQAFFKKWDHLLTKEESEMKRFTRELWTMLSKEREKIGRCFGNVIIEPGSAHELPGASKINRYQYIFIKQNASPGFSFTESQITVGEPVVVSDEKGHYALANGYVTHIHKRKITVAVDRRLHNSRVRRPGFHSQHNQDFTGVIEVDKDVPSQIEHAEPILYRVDKDEFANGMATARGNMLRMMDDTVFKAAALRSLIVQGREPNFKPTASGLTLQSQSWESEMNSDQKAAIEKVMSASDYALVLGMPGTGKTTTIAHIIRALVAQGKSVLLTSYTHTAVDNILLKIRKAGFDVLRLGVRAKIHPEVQEFAILAAEQKDSLEELQNTWYNSPVVATTCLAINHPLFAKRTFDYCIVDEASQITLPVCLGPIRMAKTFILVGDHFQLPPLVQNKEALEGGLDMSLFRLLSEGHPDAVVTLEHQYRMCSDIMFLSNKLIYSGRLKCGNESVASRSLVVSAEDALKQHHYLGNPSTSLAMPPARPCCGPASPACHLAPALSAENKVLFFNTDTLLPHSAEIVHGNRITNPLEATLTTQFVYLLLSAGVSANEIGVITFYRSQLAILRQNLRGQPGVELHTADKFQGRDKEAIIVSFVRNNTEGQVGELLKDWRRVNVAVTRARSKLILVGSKKTLLSGEEVLKGLVQICDDKGWLRNFAPEAAEAHHFPTMASQLDGLTQTQVQESPGVKRSPSKLVGTGSPSKKARRALADIEGNSASPKKRSGFKVPEKQGRIGQKGILGSRPVLRDIMNDVL